MSRVGKRRGVRFISPSVQREAIEGWAARQGVHVPEIFEELDVPGAGVQRPLLEQAVRRIEARVTSGLVVYRVDRFGRSLLDGLRVVERIRVAGGGFVAVQNGLDIESDAGRLVLQILLSVAEFQRERSRADWDAARERAIRRGLHVYGGAPVGYRRTRAGRLHPDPGIAPIITEIYQRRAHGESLGSLIAYLEGLGVRTGHGNRGWTWSTMSKMLACRTYLGCVYSGAFINEHAHPPLIDLATWQAAQHPRTLSNRSRSGSALVGLIRCAGCLGALVPRSQRSGTGGTQRVYFCLRRSSMGRCPAPTQISARLIEPLVLDTVMELLTKRRRRPAAALAAAEAKAMLAATGLARYRDNDRIARVIGTDAFLAGLDVRQRRLSDANLALMNLRARDRTHDLPALDEIRRALPQMTVAERRALIAKVIDVVFVREGRGTPPGRVIVCPAGTAPRGLPSPGRSKGRAKGPLELRRGWLTPIPRPPAPPGRASRATRRPSDAAAAETARR